jgi:ethanolamine permease
MSKQYETAPSGLKWIHVAGLGVAFAVSGSFSGWNVGLALGGWGGMLAAAVVMACFYLCLSQCVAEMGAAHPQAQGMDSYAGYGLGRAGAYFAGMSCAVAVGMTAGAGVSFIEAYCMPVLGLGGWSFKLALIVFLIAIQLRGAREAMSLTTIGGFFSVLVLLVFCAAMLPRFSAAGLYSQGAAGPTLLPHGAYGVLECIPYALFMFFGVEQAANAAGEMHQPNRNLPKALLAAVGIVLVIGMSVLVLATGGGVDRVAAADGNPLYVAMHGNASAGAGVVAWVGDIIGIGSVVSLLATTFSLVYASSRQFQSLASSGFLPQALTRVNGRHAPEPALLLVGLLTLVGTAIDANTVLVCFIFCVSVCNALVLVSFICLRRTQPGMLRPYRAIGGSVTAAVALLLSALVLSACVELQPAALMYVGLAYAGFAVHYLLQLRAAAVAAEQP